MDGCVGIRGKLLIPLSSPRWYTHCSQVESDQSRAKSGLGKIRKKKEQAEKIWLELVLIRDDEPQRHEKKGLRMETSKRIATLSLLIIVVTLVFVGCAGGPRSGNNSKMSRFEETRLNSTARARSLIGSSVKVNIRTGFRP